MGYCFGIDSTAIEEPGRFFNPLLAVLITGAARLMLGIAEKLTIDLGLDWAFCDTDSLAIARPDKLPRAEFRKRAEKIIEWFIPLNPYQRTGSILQIENFNFGAGSNRLEPLYCYAISAKRYALFNLDFRKAPILRKASAHGLGHLIGPYAEVDAPLDLSPPQVPLLEIGVARWQHDFWLKIIQAAIDGHPDQVRLDWHPALAQPAAQRYSASSPQLLAWLDEWNKGKAYDEQVRPFGFLLAYMARTGVFAEPPDLESSVVEEPKRGRPRKPKDLKPIAPYDSETVRACRTSSTGLPANLSHLTG